MISHFWSLSCLILSETLKLWKPAIYAKPRRIYFFLIHTLNLSEKFIIEILKRPLFSSV